MNDNEKYPIHYSPKNRKLFSSTSALGLLNLVKL